MYFFLPLIYNLKCFGPIQGIVNKINTNPKSNKIVKFFDMEELQPLIFGLYP